MLIIKNMIKILESDKREVENMVQEMIILDEIKEKATQKYIVKRTIVYTLICINETNI